MLRVTAVAGVEKIFRSDHKYPRFRVEADLTTLVYVYGFGFDDRVLRARSLLYALHLHTCVHALHTRHQDRKREKWILLPVVGACRYQSR